MHYTSNENIELIDNYVIIHTLFLAFYVNICLHECSYSDIVFKVTAVHRGLFD